MNNIITQFKSYIEQFLSELINTHAKIENSKEDFPETASITNCIDFLENLDLNAIKSSSEILKLIKNTEFLCAQATKSAIEISFKSDNVKFLDNEIFLLEALKSRIDNLIAKNNNKLELDRQYQEYIENKDISDGQSNTIQTKNDFIYKISDEIEKIQKKINRAQNNTITLRKMIDENNIAIVASTTEIQRQFEKLKETYSNSIDFIQVANDKIHELLTIASNSVINGSYKENSLRELRSADRLRWFAILLMLGIIIFTLFSLYDLQKQNIDKSNFIIRIFSSLLFSIPAIYLTRESSKHRNNHLFYLQKSLDLATFEPFISGVDDEKKKLLKAEMAERIFFRHQIKDSKESYPININEILQDLFSRIEIKGK